jgi:hypothetical protein
MVQPTPLSLWRHRNTDWDRLRGGLKSRQIPVYNQETGLYHGPRGVFEQSPLWDELVQRIFWEQVGHIDVTWPRDPETHKAVSKEAYKWAYDHVSPSCAFSEEVYRFELLEQDRRRVERELAALS